MRKITTALCSVSLTFGIWTLDLASAASFSDITPNSQLEEMTTYLSEKDILHGYPDGSFKPNKTINRAEALKLIFSTLGFEHCEIEKLKNCKIPFTDTPQNSWYSPYVSTALNKKIIQEKESEKREIFPEERQVSAEVRSDTIVFEEEKPSQKTLKSNPTESTSDLRFPTSDLFSDIQSPILKEAVSYLVQRGIIEGYPDNTFLPDQTINRVEALKLILSGENIENCKTEKLQNCKIPFSDVPKNAWFTPYLSTALNKNIIQGYPDGTFKPGQDVNRAEFVKMAMRSQPFYLEPTDFSPSSKQYKDLHENAWYLPTFTFGLLNDFLPLSSHFKPGAPMTRGDAAMIIYKIEKYKEELALHYQTAT